MTIKVLLADDHRLLCVALTEQLESRGFKVLDSVLRSEDVIDAYSRAKPDVLLLDIRFAPGSPSGLDVAAELIKAHPRARIVFLSQYEETAIIATGYRAGALAYVTKSAEPDTLVQAIEQAALGKTMIMPGISEQLNIALLRGTGSPRECLDDRELEVFMALAQGHTTVELAEAYGLHRKTISLTVNSIRRKLGLRTSSHHFVEFTLLAVRHMMLDPWDPSAVTSIGSADTDEH